ncbi:MAG: hypothetical protein V1913_15865 [Fibrobacterota bacterium]
MGAHQEHGNVDATAIAELKAPYKTLSFISHEGVQRIPMLVSVICRPLGLASSQCFVRTEIKDNRSTYRKARGREFTELYALRTFRSSDADKSACLRVVVRENVSSLFTCHCLFKLMC